MNVTLNAIRKHYLDGWEELLKHLGKTEPDDEPLPLITILEVCGITDAIWCLRALPKEMDNKIRLFHDEVAERVLPVWYKYYPDDDRPAKAIQAARDFANGEIDNKQLNGAKADAIAAAWIAAQKPDSAAAWGTAYAAEREAQRELFIKHFGG